MKNEGVQMGTRVRTTPLMDTMEHTWYLDQHSGVAKQKNIRTQHVLSFLHFFQFIIFHR
jgi:hypothetical protein